MKAFSYFLIAALTCAVVFLSGQSASLLPDRLLLMEYTHPAYAAHLGKEQAEIWHYPKKETLPRPARNYFLNAGRSGQYSGLDVAIQADGSIHLDGKNEGQGFSICLSPSTVFLGDGNYRLATDPSDAVFEEGQLYIEGWRTDGDVTGKKLLAVDEAGRHDFTADSRVFTTYWYGLLIPEGFTADQVVIHPTLMRTDGPEGEDAFSYTAGEEEARLSESFAAVQYPDSEKGLASFALFHMDKDDFLAIGEADMRIFLNNLTWVYGKKYGCAWCSFLFPDGTGIEWDMEETGNCVCGEADALGRITKEYGSGSWKTVLR